VSHFTKPEIFEAHHSLISNPVIGHLLSVDSPQTQTYLSIFKKLTQHNPFAVHAIIDTFHSCLGNLIKLIGKGSVYETEEEFKENSDVTKEFGNAIETYSSNEQLEILWNQTKQFAQIVASCQRYSLEAILSYEKTP